MKRMRWVWPIFVGCLLVVLAGMAWISKLALELYDTQQEASKLARKEERIRLALYRLDSAVRPIVMGEASRPYYSYESFHPVQWPYTRMVSGLEGDPLQPSQLLVFESPYILLHFQYEPPDKLTSPEAPTGAEKETAVAAYVEASRVQQAGRRLVQLREHLLSQSLSGRLPAPQEAQPLETLVQIQRAWDRQVSMANNEAQSDAYGYNQQELPYQGNEVAQQARPGQSMESNRQPQSAPAQRLQSRQQSQQEQEELRKNTQEFQARNLLTNQSFVLYNLDNYWNARRGPRPATSPVREGLLKPLWVGDVLLLARRVHVGDREVIQGCWLNWPHMQDWLAGLVEDLLPEARLAAFRPGLPLEISRALSVLPVELIPGPVDLQARQGWAPVHYALIIAWVCVLLGAGVVAGVLIQAVSLSERRGAFVSAVTHEMRTPLTTFRLYSEMLTEGMVRDESRRKQYLRRLKEEADRLHHLVDNVLAYARLSGARGKARLESFQMGPLVEGMFDRLSTHAQRAGMQLELTGEAEARDQSVRADASGLEQILLNLVDNACKYASRCGRKELELHLSVSEGQARVSLRDYGPGIAESFRPKLFRPFGKSADEAASSAPGIGLGLALSRRLARNMGGDLHLDTRWKQGAGFTVTLMRVRGSD